jgi:hypothetical protein
MERNYQEQYNIFGGVTKIYAQDGEASLRDFVLNFSDPIYIRPKKEWWISLHGEIAVAPGSEMGIKGTFKHPDPTREYILNEFLPPLVGNAVIGKTTIVTEYERDRIKIEIGGLNGSGHSLWYAKDRINPGQKWVAEYRMGK